MCGIAGFIHRHDAPSQTISRMLNALRHRGPDQFGIYEDENAVLGSARLSILDLSGGQQPIANEDERFWIVFNGEIFNYEELRAGLLAKGHRFSTNSDTEVILHLYEDLGPGCLKHLNGQFAIAIWDRMEERLFLARDRLGVRPLFYCLGHGGGLRFASEIKALLTDPQVPAVIDMVALAETFRYWSPLTPRTIFRDIKELPPGHFAVFSKGRMLVESYWQLQFHAPPEGNGWVPAPANRQRTLDEFQALLQDSVRLRLRADVPVGGYLSGGLDSSLITALVRRETSARLQTFSITFSDPEFDESQWQQHMAKFLGTEHHIVHASERDIGNAFPDAVFHAETPILRTAPVPMFLLSRLVQQSGIKVVLTGEGADEFFGGYDIFKEAVIRQFWARHPESKWRSGLLRKLYPEVARLGENSASYLAAFFKDDLNPSDPYFSHRIRWRNGNRLMRFFSPDASARLLQEQQTFDPKLPEGFYSWGALERAQYLEATVFLSQYLLSSQGDRMSMAHSVEGRYPFLDHRVVDFATHLPAYWKLRGLTEKHLLRAVAARLLPQDIAARRKRPYRAPIHRCFFPDFRPLPFVEEMLSEDAISSSGLFQPTMVAKLAHKAATSAAAAFGENDGMALAGILSAQLIERRFVQEARRIPPLSLQDDVKFCKGVPHHASHHAAAV